MMFTIFISHVISQSLYVNKMFYRIYDGFLTKNVNYNYFLVRVLFLCDIVCIVCMSYYIYPMSYSFSDYFKYFVDFLPAFSAFS